MAGAIEAVVFDLGGVVFESPVAALRALERSRGLEQGAIGGHLRHHAGHSAFAALERGELDTGAFYAAFNEELQAGGLDVTAEAVLAAIEGIMAVRPAMLGAIRALRRQGFRVAALTNNARTSAAVSERFDALKPEFDAFVESCLLGTRKPEPAIYRALGRALAVPFERMVFLDDLGTNLKAARALGMHTIKVGAPGAALAELAQLLGINLQAREA